MQGDHPGPLVLGLWVGSAGTSWSAQPETLCPGVSRGGGVTSLFAAATYWRAFWGLERILSKVHCLASAPLQVPLPHAVPSVFEGMFPTGKCSGCPEGALVPSVMSTCHQHPDRLMASAKSRSYLELATSVPRPARSLWGRMSAAWGWRPSVWMAAPAPESLRNPSACLLSVR